MNLEKLLETLINAVPEMVAMIVVVRLFIAAQRDERKAHTDALKDIGLTCHNFQREIVKDTTLALDHNSKALEKNTEALGRAADYLRVIRNNGT